MGGENAHERRAPGDGFSASLADSSLAIEWRHIKPHEHTMLLSSGSWSAMLKAAGFKMIETSCPVPGKLAIYAERVA
mgnify:CR=1 FL=1